MSPEFKAHFAGRGIPDQILEATYRYLHGLGVAGHDVLPGDDLYGVYRIANEDVDDAVTDICSSCLGRNPTNKDVQGFRDVSVEDVVELVAHIARAGSRS